MKYKKHVDVLQVAGLMLQIRLLIMLDVGVLGMSECRAVKRWNKSTKDLGTEFPNI